MSLMQKALGRLTDLLIFLLLSFSPGLFQVDALWCDRSPPGSGPNDAKTPGDNGYKIVISGESDKYVPGAQYMVRLQGSGDQYTVDKFSGFLLVVEPADGHSPESAAGSFQLAPDSLARFSEYCPSAIKHSSELPKAEIHVRWTAPSVAAAGCVVFRATVIKNKGVWFMDDGQLTKQLCPENDFGLDENEAHYSTPCCACDEAKYELTFEGLWTSLTHPKDFPADTLSAHFSDIIGASHSSNFRFWEYGGESSDGLKNLAETGDPKDLETELKDKSGNIRTIIKARGLKNPNFYGHKTFAVFRSDKDNNLISIVSKIVPSPDWFVGVSGLNLCLPNCTWSANKVVNLFPWDAGTNNGISYSAPGDATIPRDRIRRIVWTNNENSPFFDPSGNMVRPFARLTLTKQRSYGSCDTELRKVGSGSDYGEDDMYDDSEHQHKPECQVTLWTEWSVCSVTCGKGAQTRMRQYVNPSKAGTHCNRKLIDKKNCYNQNSCKKPTSTSSHSYSQYGSGGSSSSSGSSGHHHRPESGHGHSRSSACLTSDWYPWSQCSATCGRGRRTRERKYLQPSMAHDHKCNKALQEHEGCVGPIADCSDVEQVEHGCETTNWSEWGPCSVTCGRGSRVRTRYFVNSRVSHQKCDLELTQYETCTGVRPDCSHPDDMKEICQLPKQVGMCPNDGNLTRWYFDVQKMRCQKFTFHPCKGNQNNFLSEKDCETACAVLRENLGDSGRYYSGMGSVGTGSSELYPNRGVNNNHNHNSHNNNGGQRTNNNWPSYQPYNNNPSSFGAIGPPVDCVMSEWSDWSMCSTTCGRGHKYKSRYIKVFAQNGGRPCPQQLKVSRKCKVFACEPNHPYRYMNTADQYQE